MFTVGDKLGLYIIRHRIGAGGMGEVYLAEHVHMGRKAAIKVLLPEFSSRPDIVARFFNEARATGQLRHPNIVEIFDCDIHTSGRAFIVMELLEGETLGRCLARLGNMQNATRSVAAITGQVAGALAAAHEKGIVHRDLKPDNVFLAAMAGTEEPTRVKILDFGIAKLLGDGAPGTRKTRTGSLLGTPLYMSPEQCRNAGQIDHRTDIYSLGCIVFELLTGRPPFVREGYGELIIAHNSEPPPDLALLLPELPRQLTALVGRMLAKDTAQRPQSMREIVREVGSLLNLPPSRFSGEIQLPGESAAPGASQAAPAGESPRQASPRSPIAAATTMKPQETPPAPAADRVLPPTRVQPQQTQAVGSSGKKNTTLSGAASTAQAAPRGHRRRTVGISVAALALGVVAMVVLVPRLWTLPAASVRSSPPVAPAPPAAAAVTPPLPANPSTIKVDLERAPAGLVVELDGQPAAVPVLVPYGSALHQLKLTAPGFEPEALQVDGTRDKTVVLNMKRLPGEMKRLPGEVSAPPEKPRKHSSPVSPVRVPRSATDSPPAAVKVKKNEGFTDL